MSVGTRGMPLERVVSGGQTGVDRAALDVALILGIPIGGWCPQGRKAEDARLPAHYPLRETPSDQYAERTEWNVRDSDGTLILTRGPVCGGTSLTRVLAQRMNRPYLVMQLDEFASVEAVLKWIERERIRILNVAGPRQSSQPQIYAAAVEFLTALFKQTKPRKKPHASPRKQTGH